MKKYSSTVFRLAILSVFIFSLVRVQFAASAPASSYSFTGGLEIEPIAAYNLIVDSNVLSPSSYGPNAATLGAKFCNRSSSTMHNVWAYIGEYATRTPGQYPVHNLSTDTNFNTAYPHLSVPPTAVDFGDPTRFYALEHASGSVSDTVDASRFIGTLAAGECRTQYWLVTYPRKAMINGGWVDVTGGIKPQDDLWLQYDFWGTVGSSTSYYLRYVTLRNEISAMANKIWPNGDNKVPEQYVAAIQKMVGWDTWTPNGTGTTAYPGETVTSQGIWYDLGNIGAGFDNDGNFVPDRNIWVQPIGDVVSYDPGCFQLVRTFGLIIIKLNDGTEQLIPFVDQMYFENIPDNNNGAVGLVYYEYIALDGACTAGLTPYQEVASGYDNEKFNADFGAGIPSLQSQQSNMTLDKSGDEFLPSSREIIYTLTANLPDPDSAVGSTSKVSIGSPTVGMPLVFHDAIPGGTVYVASSAKFNTLGVTGKILYSINGGNTFTTTLPLNLSTITHLEWWLDEPVISSIDETKQVQVEFKVSVPSGYVRPTVHNESCLKFGNGPCFTEDTFTTKVPGNSAITGLVWKDNGTGTGGVLGNGAIDGAEAGIGGGDGVTVKLYWDNNGDGDYDDLEDFLYATTTTNLSGYYCFGGVLSGATCSASTAAGLPAASGSAAGSPRYIIVVESGDNDIPSGYGPTTTTTYTNVALASNSVYGDAVDASEPSDFGFAPALSVTKQLLSTSPAPVGSYVTFRLSASNILPGDGGAGSTCVYRRFATSEGSISTSVSAYSKRFDDDLPTTPATTIKVFSSPQLDGRYASADFAAAGTQIISGAGASIGTQSGKITNVKAQIRYYLSTPLIDDYGGLQYWAGMTPTLYASTPLGTTAQQTAARIALNAHVGQANSGWFELDLGATNPATSTGWTWNDFAPGNTIQIVYESGKTGSGDQVIINVDAIAVQVTSDGSCGSEATVLNPVPLIDQFDNRYLTLLSAVPSISSQSTAGNDTTLTWDNIGPLYPGQTKQIEVTFQAKATIVSPGTTNKTESTHALFVSGNSANSDLMSETNNKASVIIDAPSGQSISGFIWNDANNNGWQGTVGFETSPLDVKVSGATVQLYACGISSNNGASIVTYITSLTPGFVSGTSQCNSFTEKIGNTTYTAQFWPVPGTAGTTTTDINGYYRFVVPTPGFYYVSVPVLPAISGVMPGQTAEPLQSGTGASCASSCDNSWMNTGILAANASNVVLSTNFNEVTSNENIGNINFGYRYASYGTGSSFIGDRLYYDWDGQGDQDAMDEGIPNVTVQLYRDLDGDGVIDANEPVAATTSTNSDGKYCFGSFDGNGNCASGSLPGGSYIIRIDTTNGQFPNSVSLTGDPDEIGTCTTCNGISSASVNGANSVLTVDFGYKPTGSGTIGDTVFVDINGDGTQSSTEPGISGITVKLQVDLNGDGIYATIATKTTDAEGNYLFTDLPAGTYRIEIDRAANASAIPNDVFGNDYLPSIGTASGSAVYVSKTLATSTSHELTADFGFAPPASIGDTIYQDINGNGAQDLAEPGINGVTVNLYTFSDNNANSRYDPGDTLSADPISSTTTAHDSASNRDGVYRFTGLLPGYYVVVVDHTDAELANANFTGDPNMDGVPCNTTSPQPVCDHRDGMRLYNGTNYSGADFGYQLSGAFGDTVWIDSDNDGKVDIGEQGIPNITVKLFVDANGDGVYTLVGDGATPYAAAVTDANGNYFFTHIANGNYVVLVDNTAADGDAVDPDFPSGLTSTSDPDGNTDSQTRVIVSGGAVTRVGGLLANDDDGDTSDPLYLDADFGFDYLGNSTLSGTVCLDALGSDTVNDTYASDPGDQIGICGDNALDASGVDTPAGESAYSNVTVYLYRWTDDGDGIIETGETVQVATSTTNSAGDYLFTSIPDNTSYIVSIGAPQSSLELTSQTGDSPTIGNDAQERVVESSATGADATAYLVVRVGTGATVENADFAFTASGSYDFGDLPASYSTTLQGVPDGARHLQPAGGFTRRLGTTDTDTEVNGAPGEAADGDGTDEDGVLIPVVAENTDGWSDGVGTLQYNIVGSGWLVGWIDYNRDGDFADANEMVISRAVSAGDNQSFNITTPTTTFASGYVYARFRLFASQPPIPALAYSGSTVDGDVEDYRFYYSPTSVDLASFTAVTAPRLILVHWETAMELNTIGFNLYRSTSLDGERVLLNSEMITSQAPGGLFGGDYDFIDADVKMGQAYYYWLEFIDTTSTKVFGPVAVVAVGTGIYLPVITR